ncbi:hypothetical protein KJ966_21575 [bacterium]|nr:hypothetical protein [bacterium]
MFDLIKRTMLMSVGLAFLTKDKVEELANEIIEKGKLSGKESKEFFEELLKKSEESSQKVEEQIKIIINDTLKKMNLATRDELSEIKEELKKMKQAMKQKGEKA